MRLKNIHIARYGPLNKRELPCTPGINVIYGQNESGKTLIIDAVLRLLLDAADKCFPGVARVDESPEGFLVFDTIDGEKKVGRENKLNDLAPLTPRELKNIFVIRNSDLSISHEVGFYGQLTERLVGLRTSTIDELIETVRDMGKLTPSGSLTNRSPEKVRSTREVVHSLATAIDKYLQENEDIEVKEAHIFGLKAQLKKLRDEQIRLENARRRDEWDDLSKRLQQLKHYDMERQQTVFSRNAFDELKRLDYQIEQAQVAIKKLGDQAKEYRGKAEQRRQRAGSVRLCREAGLRDFTRGEELKEQAESLLTEITQKAGRARRSLSLLRPLAVTAGLAFFSSLVFGTLGVASWPHVLGTGIPFALMVFLWNLASRRLITLTQREQQLLVRGAGLGISARDLHTLIVGLGRLMKRRDKLERLQSRYESEAAQFQSLADSQQKDLRTEQDNLFKKRELQAEILKHAGVQDVMAYEAGVLDIEAKQSEAKTSRGVLESKLGPAETTKQWEDVLNKLRLGINFDNSSSYDSARALQIEQEIAALEAQLNELSQTVHAHRDRLAEFSRLAAGLSLPEVSRADPGSVSVFGMEGLRQLREQLAQLEKDIDENAEVSREVIEILSDIKAEEQTKVSRLFENGRAAEIISKVTGGRITKVGYKPEQNTLIVTRGEKTLLPSQLSHGTYDQLYLGIRISLAEQILAQRCGFFILDDAFLAADSTRLKKQFEVLEDISEDGWQILYFTAKDEVRKLAQLSGYSLIQVDPLP